MRGASSSTRRRYAGGLLGAWGGTSGRRRAPRGRRRAWPARVVEKSLRELYAHAHRAFAARAGELHAELEPVQRQIMVIDVACIG